MSAERKPKAGEKWLWESRIVEIVHSEPDTYDRFVVRYFDTNDRPIYALAYRSILKPIKRTVREVITESGLPLLPGEGERLAVAIEMEYPELKQ